VKRNLVIDNLRGIAMLGVIGIHIGTFVLSSSTPRLDLFLILQIFTRFAVPAFFFISGFGLFAGDALNRPFNYTVFLKKRFIAVGIPYVVWSLFYILLWQRQDVLYRYGVNWYRLFVKLFLGEGCYHIYFLVILLWVYVTFPFWRRLVGFLSRQPAGRTFFCLAVLAGLQVALYRWSAGFWYYPAWVKGHDFLLRLLNERMNYVPLFYGFVFVLGAMMAVHEEKVSRWLREHLGTCFLVFLASCAVLLVRFKTFWDSGMDLPKIPEYMTQLTPEGLFYTVAWLLFFCALLERYRERPLVFLKILSGYSLVVYLIHPYIMACWYSWFGMLGIPYHHVPVLVYYVLVLCTSLVCGAGIEWLSRRVPVAGLLLLGKKY